MSPPLRASQECPAPLSIGEFRTSHSRISPAWPIFVLQRAAIRLYKSKTESSGAVDVTRCVGEETFGGSNRISKPIRTRAAVSRLLARGRQRRIKACPSKAPVTPSPVFFLGLRSARL